MRKGWEIRKLGDVCLKITDGSHNPPKGVEISEYLMLSSRDIFDEQIHYDNPRFISKKDFENEDKRTAIKANDVLLTIVGTIGRVAVVPNKHPNFTLQRSVAVLRPNTNEIDSYFLKFLLQNSLNFLISESRGAAQKGIYLNQLKQIQISLPLLSEQQEIVSILDDAFKSIERAKSNAEQNLKNAKELFDSYLQNVFENKGEDWEKTSLGDVLVKTETIDPTKYPNMEFVYLDVSSVNKESKEIETTTKLLGKDAPSRARKLIRTNDVIFATVRPTHSRVAMITVEYDKQVCSTGYFVLRAKEILSNKFIFYFLLTNRFNKQMEKLQKGASYPAVTDTEIKGIKISFPKSLKEQNKIVKKLEVLSVEIKNLESIYKQKLNDLEELKKSILQKAFNGDLINSK